MKCTQILPSDDFGWTIISYSVKLMQEESLILDIFCINQVSNTSSWYPLIESGFKYPLPVSTCTKNVWYITWLTRSLSLNCFVEYLFGRFCVLCIWMIFRYKLEVFVWVWCKKLEIYELFNLLWHENWFK